MILTLLFGKLQIYRVCLLWGRQAQHQDNSRSTIGMSPHHFPPPGLFGPHGKILLSVFHVEYCHVEEKLGLTITIGPVGSVVMHKIL